MIDYLEQGCTINGAYYAGQSRLLRQKEGRKIATTECGFEILPHPPYSPDMTPSNFYLFAKLKSHFRGTLYVSNEGVIEAVKEYLGD